VALAASCAGDAPVGAKLPTAAVGRPAIAPGCSHAEKRTPPMRIGRGNAEPASRKSGTYDGRSLVRMPANGAAPAALPVPVNATMGTPGSSSDGTSATELGTDDATGRFGSNVWNCICSFAPCRRNVTPVTRVEPAPAKPPWYRSVCATLPDGIE
jgi:hypothetical protein